MSQAQPIAEFLNLKREHDTCTLLAKGPSLDKYDPAHHAEGYVFGVNEVPLVLPCHAALYIDVKIVDVDFPLHVTLFRLDKFKESHGGRGFSFAVGDLPRLGSGNGAGAFALTIMGLWGIKRVVLWGYDCMLQPLGGDPQGAAPLYAECVKPHCRFMQSSYTYEAVARTTRAVLDHFKFQVEFHHG